MAEAILDLRLDTVQPNRVRLVYGVQNDYNSRYICARFTVNGKPIEIENTAAVRINAKRPDGERNAFPGTVNADGTVNVPVAQWMLDVPGEVSASVTAATSNSALTTQDFYIMAKPSNWDGTGTPSEEDPDKDVIQTIIESQKTVKNEVKNKASIYALKASYATDCLDASMFENGTINEATGADSTYDSPYTPWRLRTTGFIPPCDVIKCNNGYLFHVFVYDLDGKYITWVSNLQEYSALDFTQYNYRILLRTTGHEEEISIDEVENIFAFKDKLPIQETYEAVFTESAQEIIFRRGYIHGALGTIQTSVVSVVTSNFLRAANGSTVTVKAGYMFRVATYASDNEESFIKCTANIMSGEVYTFTKDTYFRAYICRIDEAESGIDIANNFIFNIPTVTVTKASVKSVFDRTNKVYFGNVPAKYFKSPYANGSNEGFNANTTTSEFYTKFNNLVSAYPEYITKTDLGACSDGTQHLYEYTLKPQSDSFETFKTMPKVLMIGAQHGFEKSNIFGLYYFVKNLLENIDDELISYLRSQVIFKIIPICNPYGFDNSEYLNANGVNLNRNYDTGHFPQYPDAVVGDAQYGGQTPFDQPETQIVRKFVNDNRDAFLFLDLHTNGQSSVTSYEQVNWVSLQNTDDEYFYQMHDAVSSHFRAETLHFKHDYNLPSTAVIGMQDGEFGSRTISCTSCEWVYQQGIISATLEGFNGFPSSTPFTMEVYKANTEIIANFVKCVLANYA
ncbi:MAG: hypothetical protein IJW79_00215 [Clostridia bacterium]|nr:hypothetical protein [Clostridia bacterium]